MISIHSGILSCVVNKATDTPKIRNNFLCCLHFSLNCGRAFILDQYSLISPWSSLRESLQSNAKLSNCQFRERKMHSHDYTRNSVKRDLPSNQRVEFVSLVLFGNVETNNNFRYLRQCKLVLWKTGTKAILSCSVSAFERVNFCKPNINISFRPLNLKHRKSGDWCKETWRFQPVSHTAGILTYQ